MREAAVAAASSVGYRNAGTVEFLLDTLTGDFVFLEMNTRIQVEHPVTELVWGVDLVEQQISIAQTGRVTDDFDPQLHGHAIEIRVCAEDPVRFFPSPGPIEEWVEPTGPCIRVDAGYCAGVEVTPYFDPMIAKICTYGDGRAEALARAQAAMADLVVGPLKTNVPFLIKLPESPEFVSGNYGTNIVDNLKTPPQKGK